jgi:hypothetical protein
LTGYWRVVTFWSMNNQMILELVRRVVEEETKPVTAVLLELQAALNRARADLERISGAKSSSTGSSPKVRSPAAITSPPVTQRVAKVLVMRGPMPFGDLLKAVEPATRAAVKSALNKGRERGEFTFKNGLYGIVDKKKPTRGAASRGSTATTAPVT